MIDLTFEINPKDEERVNRLIEGLARGLTGQAVTVGPNRDLRTLLNSDVLPYLQRRARERFYAHGDDASGKWFPLRPATQRWRAWTARRYGLAIKPHEPINRRTGQLRTFVTQTYDVKSNQNSAELVMPSRKGVDRWLGVKLSHAQLGGRGPTGRAFPRRPVAALGASDKVVIDRLTLNWVEDMLEALR